MLKTHIDGWKIDGQFVEVERMLKWRAYQVLCNGAVVVWSEYDEEDGWQPTCYVREPFRPIYVRYISFTNGLPFLEDIPF